MTTRTTCMSAPTERVSALTERSIRGSAGTAGRADRVAERACAALSEVADLTDRRRMMLLTVFGADVDGSDADDVFAYVSREMLAQL